MQALKYTSKRLLSLLMAAILVLGTTSTAFAHAEGEEGDHEHDQTPYSISIYNGKQPNQNGTLTYTVTSHEDGTVSQVYSLENDTDIYAMAGDTITLYPVADEGYVLSSLGYVKSERLEGAFNIKTVSADKTTGAYTFTMPDYPIHVGAAFYAKDDYYVTSEAGTSNAVANADPRHVLELGLNHAWIHENTEEISVDMYVDARILTIEEETGKQMTFRMEIRQVGDAGFLIKGAKEYTTAQLKALIEEKGAQPLVDDKGRTYYILRDVKIPVDADKDFDYTDDGEYEVYCTAMFTLEGWTNAIGAKNYRWGYSGGDRAYIMENGTPIPTSMVYLYNLDPESYHGALVAEAIDRVEEEMGVTIETRYFNADNMTECIGYLAEWPGYESFGELGVDRQPSEKVFKKKIVLYCSLPSMVRDAVGDAVRETGVTQYMTTKLTAYGAAKSFEELYKNQEAESEVFTAALALSLLAYEASEAVPESVYGEHELWPEFCAAMAAARALINEADEVAEPYKTARAQLMDVYLRIIGKTQLDIDFQFIIEEYDADNYKVTVDQSSFPEDLEVEYYWYDASKLDHLIIPKDQLYKVRCSISAVDDGPWYGFKEIRLAVPGELEYQISAKHDRISVSFTKYATLPNTPEPITYTAELYRDGELQETLSNETGAALIFRGLDASTEYSVRIYAANIVGRTTYLTENVLTGNAASGGSSSGGSSSTERVDKVENPFADVADDAYYHDAVLWAVENDITSGTSDNTFSPDAVCTRAQTVTFLWRAAGAPQPKTQVCPFADVFPDDYYYDAVLWAVENGITSGTSADTFSPNVTVTRAQNITFLWKLAKAPAADNHDPFVDVTEEAYYHDAVVWAVNQGITSGTSADTFSPDAPCLRGQIMTFLYRFMMD